MSELFIGIEVIPKGKFYLLEIEYKSKIKFQYLFNHKLSEADAFNKLFELFGQLVSKEQKKGAVCD